MKVRNSNTKLQLFIIFTAFVFSIISNKQLLANELPSSINFCGGGAEWPPFIYWKRDKNGNKTKNTMGYTVDVLTKIFAQQNIKVNFSLLPWKRCLDNVKKGEFFSVAVDASFSKQRNRDYLLSDTYYSITPKIFYQNDGNKKLPKFESFSELQKLGSVCGLHGYNYEGFLKDIKNKNIDRGAKDFAGVVKKLKLGNCKTFLARYEIIKGFKNIGQDFDIDTNILSTEFKEVNKDKFYLLISRNIKYSKELKQVFDAGIKQMKRDGSLELLLNKFVNNK